jgi:hypothetical protein
MLYAAWTPGFMANFQIGTRFHVSSILSPGIEQAEPTPDSMWRGDCLIKFKASHFKKSQGETKTVDLRLTSREDISFLASLNIRRMDRS